MIEVTAKMYFKDIEEYEKWKEEHTVDIKYIELDRRDKRGRI